MLLARSDTTYQQTIERAYGTFRPKIVDIALQTRGWPVFVSMEIDDEETCRTTKNWGECKSSVEMSSRPS